MESCLAIQERLSTGTACTEINPHACVDWNVIIIVIERNNYCEGT